jgi:hypothetical protein
MALTGTSHASEAKQNISPIYLADKGLGAKVAKGWSTTHIMHRVNFAVLMSIKNSPDCGRIIEQAKINKASLSNKEELQLLACGIHSSHIVGVVRTAIRIGLDNFSTRCAGPSLPSCFATAGVIHDYVHRTKKTEVLMRGSISSVLGI